MNNFFFTAEVAEEMPQRTQRNGKEMKCVDHRWACNVAKNSINATDLPPRTLRHFLSELRGQKLFPETARTTAKRFA